MRDLRSATDAERPYQQVLLGSAVDQDGRCGGAAGCREGEAALSLAEPAASLLEVVGPGSVRTSAYAPACKLLVVVSSSTCSRTLKHISKI